jgi:hypothetical protein
MNDLKSKARTAFSLFLNDLNQQVHEFEEIEKECWTTPLPMTPPMLEQGVGCSSPITHFSFSDQESFDSFVYDVTIEKENKSNNRINTPKTVKTNVKKIKTPQHVLEQVADLKSQLLNMTKLNSSLKSRIESITATCQLNKESFEDYKQKEIANIEIIKQEEMKKIAKERLLWEKHKKATDILPNKK